MKCLARAMTAVAAVLAMAACTPQFTSELSPNPKTSAQLRALALSAKNAPPGIKVSTAGPVDDRQTYLKLGGGAMPSCGNLNSVATEFIYGSTLNQPVGSTVVGFSQPAGDGAPWIAVERLTSYAPGLAHFVMRDLTDQINGCSVYMDGELTYRMSFATGPALGDESLRIRQQVSVEYRDPIQSEADTIVIRSGDNLIIVEEVLRPLAAHTPLEVVTAAAYRAFTTG